MTVAAAAVALLSTAANAADIIPHVEISRDSDHLMIEAFVTGSPGDTVEGEMTLMRTSGSNSLQTRQASSVTIGEDGIGHLARTRIDAARPTEISAFLTISRDAQEIGQTQVTLTLTKTETD